MSVFKNIFLCLVHEKPECVADLVRNLRYFDAGSDILLYNGSDDPALLDGFPFQWYGAEIYPNPTPKRWGWLHGFALDGMRHALQHRQFDTITIVDSDQLLIKKGYSELLQKKLENHANIGMFGITAGRQTGFSQSPVAAHAAKEKSLWLPLLKSLPGGEDSFSYWTFWPSTVFTQAACKALVNIFDTNQLLKEILEKTTIWASEELILPTLVKALGFNIAENPCRYDYVQYKKNYTQQNIQQGINTPNVFWVHPVLRNMKNELRKFIAKQGNYYVPERSEDIFTEIITETKNIKGWLSTEEAELLIETTAATLRTNENPVVVEVGAYCGKSTCVMGMTALKSKKKMQLYVVDTFEGRVGADDDRTQHHESTHRDFKNSIDKAGIRNMVTELCAKAYDVEWNSHIDFLLIDGLHDYFNAAGDFFAFSNWLKKGAVVAFHDYADYYPGVKSLVAEIVQTGEYNICGLKGTLIVLQKTAEAINVPVNKPKKAIEPVRQEARIVKEYPLVSCITPTYNRSELLQESIMLFLQQEYENKELVIIDDSPRPEASALVSDFPFIRYFHLDERHTIGEKRNIACRHATGDIIVHWDDDDWYGTQWIYKQVQGLAGGEITGLDKPYFYSEKLRKAWQYIYPENEKKWVHGATMAYWKKAWQHSPFSKINIGEDNQFVWRTGRKVMAHTHTEGYVGRVHPGNTSPKYTANVRWKPTDAANIERIIERTKIPVI